ncbi:hypothetical protein, partial [Rhodococcus chondri]
SFDQWGVELGKVQATQLQPAVSGTGPVSTGDGSTDALIATYRRMRER